MNYNCSLFFCFLALFFNYLYYRSIPCSSNYVTIVYGIERQLQNIDFVRIGRHEVVHEEIQGHCFSGGNSYTKIILFLLCMYFFF